MFFIVLFIVTPMASETKNIIKQSICVLSVCVNSVAFRDKKVRSFFSNEACENSPTFHDWRSIFVSRSVQFCRIDWNCSMKWRRMRFKNHPDCKHCIWKFTVFKQEFIVFVIILWQTLMTDVGVACFGATIGNISISVAKIVKIKNCIIHF